MPRLKGDWDRLLEDGVASPCMQHALVRARREKRLPYKDRLTLTGWLCAMGIVESEIADFAVWLLGGKSARSHEFETVLRTIWRKKKTFSPTGCSRIIHGTSAAPSDSCIQCPFVARGPQQTVDEYRYKCSATKQRPCKNPLDHLLLAFDW
jgi:hypothetical protein